MASHGPRELNKSANLSQRFRQAAFEGKSKLVRRLFPLVDRRDEFGIDIKIALDLAAGEGHLPVVKYLYGKLQPKSVAISGLFEAARMGQFLTVQWLLAQPDFHYEQISLPSSVDAETSWNEALSTASRIAATNQHWATMLEIMTYAKQYIKARHEDSRPQPLYKNCSLEGCDTNHSAQKQDLLLIESFDQLSCSSVYIPSSSRIPKAVLGKANVEQAISRNIRNVR